MLPVDAMPPLVANPSTVILATAVGTPEPNLTRLHIAAVVDATVIVDDALIANTPTALVVATALTVCGLVRTRITFSVMLDVVVDVAELRVQVGHYDATKTVIMTEDDFDEYVSKVEERLKTIGYSLFDI